MQDSQLIQHSLHNPLHQARNADDFYRFAAFNNFTTKLEQPDLSFPEPESSTHSGLLFQQPIFDSSLSCLFSPSQIACICKTLYLNREGERLNQFFESQQHAQQLCDPARYGDSLCSSHDYAAIFCAYIFSLYHQGNYEELFERIKYSKLDAQYHSELQKLWYDAHYAEDQRKKTKKLGPVDKYRIRHKNPPPSSIWDGEKVIYAFKEKQRKILLEYYRCNRYPKPDEKQEIARRTGLKMPQIANWFKNKRQRNKSTPPDNEIDGILSQSLLDGDSLALGSTGFF